MKRVRAPIGLLLLAVIADVAFTKLAGHEGLLAPFGPVRLATVLSGALAVSTRLVATAVLLPWLVWRLSAKDAPRD